MSKLLLPGALCELQLLLYVIRVVGHRNHKAQYEDSYKLMVFCSKHNKCQSQNQDPMHSNSSFHIFLYMQKEPSLSRDITYVNKLKV